MLRLPVLKLQKICTGFHFKRKGREGKWGKEGSHNWNMYLKLVGVYRTSPEQIKRVCYCPCQPQSYRLSITGVVMASSLSHGPLGTPAKKSQQSTLSQVLWMKGRFFIKTKEKKKDNQYSHLIKGYIESEIDT